MINMTHQGMLSDAFYGVIFVAFYDAPACL